MSGGGLSLLADLTRRDRAALDWRKSTTFRAPRGNGRENGGHWKWPNAKNRDGRDCIAYAKTVAEAMKLKLDMDNPVDREKLRRAVLDLVAGRKMPKQKGHG